MCFRPNERTLLYVNTCLLGFVIILFLLVTDFWPLNLIPESNRYANLMATISAFLAFTGVAAVIFSAIQTKLTRQALIENREFFQVRERADDNFHRPRPEIIVEDLYNAEGVFHGYQNIIDFYFPRLTIFNRGNSPFLVIFLGLYAATETYPNGQRLLVWTTLAFTDLAFRIHPTSTGQPTLFSNLLNQPFGIYPGDSMLCIAFQILDERRNIHTNYTLSLGEIRNGQYFPIQNLGNVGDFTALSIFSEGSANEGFPEPITAQVPTPIIAP